MASSYDQARAQSKNSGGRPRVFSAGAVIFGAAALSACSGADIDFSLNTDTEEGSGTITTETHELSGFEGISFCCGLDVEVQFQESATQSVEITLDDNLHRFLEVEVDGSELRIAPEDGVNLDPTDPMIVRVSGPDLTSLEAEAGSNVVAVWPSVSTLDLDVDAGADVTLTIDVDILTVDADAGSDVTLEGRADVVIASADAAADIRLTAVEVIDATVDADAGSNIEIDASGTITGSADAGSDIDIWGDPERVDIDADISSDVNYKN